MRHSVDPQQGRLFDPYDGIIPPLGRERIDAGWQGVFRKTLLQLMPVGRLAKHFHPVMGRPTKELYSVAGLLFLQEFQNWTVPQAVEAYLFRTDVQFALNLEPGASEMCERTFERYRKLFIEDDSASQVMDAINRSGIRHRNSAPAFSLYARFGGHLGGNIGHVSPKRLQCKCNADWPQLIEIMELPTRLRCDPNVSQVT